jgi:hypothetical protein
MDKLRCSIEAKSHFPHLWVGALRRVGSSGRRSSPNPESACREASHWSWNLPLPGSE